MDKVRLIANQPALLRNLRVCAADSVGQLYNCGRCWKCLMTMVALLAVGALDACPTLPHEIDPEAVKGASVPDQWYYWHEIFLALGSSPLEQSLKAVLKTCLDL